MDEAGSPSGRRAHQRQLLRSAYLLTGDLHRAQDLVQEALVKVALRWPRLRDGNPTAYARTIIVRDNISWWRRQRETCRRRGAPTSSDVSSDPVTALVVQRSLARLTPRQRAVLVLRHFDDLTERETAEILGITVGTVKSTNAAALARLREGAPELLDLIGGPDDRPAHRSWSWPPTRSRAPTWPGTPSPPRGAGGPAGEALSRRVAAGRRGRGVVMVVPRALDDSSDPVARADRHADVAPTPTPSPSEDGAGRAADRRGAWSSRAWDPSTAADLPC